METEYIHSINKDSIPFRDIELYKMYIIAPVIGNYSINIISVTEYNDIGVFPVDITDNINNSTYRDITEDNFMKTINDILINNTVKRRIENVYQQSINHINNVKK